MAGREHKGRETPNSKQDPLAGVCHLGRQAPAVENSHVVPEWGYLPLYDGRHRFLHLQAGPRPATHYAQKGIREPLLCDKCATRFSRFENSARNLLNVPGRLCIPPPGSLASSQVEYRSFKLFQLSLLWRAHLGA